MANYTTVCSPQLFRSPENLLFRLGLFPWVNDQIDITNGMTLTLKNPTIFFQVVKGAPYSEGTPFDYNQIDYSDIATQHADFVNLGENIMSAFFSNTWLPYPLQTFYDIQYTGDFAGYSARYSYYPDASYNSVLNTYALFSNYWANATAYNPKEDMKAALNIAKRSNLKGCFCIPGKYNAIHLGESWTDFYNFSLVPANNNRLPAYLGFELIQYS